LLVPGILRGPDESGSEVVSLGRIGPVAGSMGNSPATIAISFVLRAIALAGWIRTWRQRAELLVPLTIAMVVIVPVWTFRYLVPLTPFIIGYFAAGLRTPTTDPWRVARLAPLCVIGLDLLDHVRSWVQPHN